MRLTFSASSATGRPPNRARHAASTPESSCAEAGITFAPGTALASSPSGPTQITLRGCCACAPRRGGSIKRKPLQHSRPGLRQPGADKHNAVAANARLIRGRREHAEGALDVDIGERFARRQMIESALQPLGQEDRGARAGDVGAQAGDERKGRAIENFGGVSICVVKRYRLAVERRCPHPYPDSRPAPATLKSMSANSALSICFLAPTRQAGRLLPRFAMPSSRQVACRDVRLRHLHPKLPRRDFDGAGEAAHCAPHPICEAATIMLSAARA